MGFNLFSENEKIKYGIKNYIADYKKDLKNIPKNPVNMVYVIEESKYYLANNQNIWIEYNNNNNNNDNDKIVPTGTINITENGNNIDISKYAFANINVSIPELTNNISAFSDYNEEGCPQTITIFCDGILPSFYCYRYGSWPQNNNTKPSYFVRYVKKVVFMKNITNLNNAFSLAEINLYDFSNYTSNTIPVLPSVNSLGRENGCIIRVPKNLLSEWQTATNWCDLSTDPNEEGYIVWEGIE